MGEELADDTVVLLLPLLGLALPTEFCKLEGVTFEGDEVLEVCLEDDLGTLDFFVVCGVGVFRLLLCGGISRGSLDDLEDLCVRVLAGGGRALDVRGRRVGVFASLLEPDLEAME